MSDTKILPRPIAKSGSVVVKLLMRENLSSGLWI